MRAARPTRLAVATAAVALFAIVATPLPASAAPGDDVLVFSNPSVVDTSPGVDGGEYEWISAALTAGGYDVVPFDGGDGSDTAWTTALTDIEVFVLPEQEAGDFYDPTAPPAWLSEAAKDALVAWVRAGGVMLQSSACDPVHVSVMSEAVGVDYADAVDCSATDPAPRWIDDATLPAQLDDANGTYGFSLTTMSAEQLAPLTVWYAGSELDDCSGALTESLAVGVFTAGSGRVAFEGWDYFNDTDNDQVSWNQVLASLIDGNPAASTWEAATPPAPGEPKTPVTATAPSGEWLFTISPENTCDTEHRVFRVDPSTAAAAPIATAEIDGDARQGAWNSANSRGYFPFEDDDSGDDLLMIVNPATGGFAEVGEFTTPDLDYIDEVFGLAIAPDGDAYMMAQLEIGDTFYELALFSLNLSTGGFSLISAIDDSQLDEPNGFAIDPSTGLAYAFEEDSHEFFRVDLATGALTALGDLDAPSLQGSSDVTALQIGTDGTFWAVFDDSTDSLFEDAGMLVSFTLADISGGTIDATEQGVITDDEMPSWSLLLTPSLELPATGTDPRGLVGGALLLMLLGGAVLGARALRSRTRSV
ncbi:hypothetical protein [Microcella sp.]|uniref:hypothetical protein n=1 Tax=Microcella sp. TaxID=1913979 RepID=UPI00391C14C1